MERAIKNILIAVSLFVFASSFAYCEAIEINDLVEEYNNATGVQKPQIEEKYRYTVFSVSGVIENVEDWNTFDERTDTAGNYYRVIARPQVTASGISYRILVFYKNKASVESLGKDQEIKTSGSLLKIIDEFGSFSIWIYADPLSPEDKVMLAV